MRRVDSPCGPPSRGLPSRPSLARPGGESGGGGGRAAAGGGGSRTFSYDGTTIDSRASPFSFMSMSVNQSVNARSESGAPVAESEIASSTSTWLSTIRLICTSLAAISGWPG